MGTASQFDSILKEELNIHAAWVPITNTFRLGDYGLISSGVLVKAGNISNDFGVSFDQAPGPPSVLNFTSKGTKSLRFAAGAQVNAFPDNDVDAKLSVEFASASSFLAKANLMVAEMQNVNAVAKRLVEIGAWKRKYIVVSAVYFGKQCAIISSKSANSKIELSGKANALKQFDLGAVAANVESSTKQDIGLDLVGESGVVGLSLFKLPWGWGDDPKTLGGGELKVAKSTDADWPKMLPDDM
jgi:uncharacterized DUF497 family protein